MPKHEKEAQNPLLLRSHRLIETFAKSDDERDFYIDRREGFILYVDLDKSQEELDALEKELQGNSARYCAIPKLSYYENKKIMEGFVNEKVYDIDTKEKLSEIIQSKEAKENFLEFIYDHLTELEKWQQYYQERSRIRIIEWLRQNHFHFVFEEDLDLHSNVIENLKRSLFEESVDKELQSARKALLLKAKTYYSNEALNPRPKRGRPPKQVVKPEFEPQVTTDIYMTIPTAVRPFLFIGETPSTSITSSKFDHSAPLVRSIDGEGSLNQKLSLLRGLSSRWMESHSTQPLDGDEEEKPVSAAKKGSSAKSAAKGRAALPSKSSTKALPPSKNDKGHAAAKKDAAKREAPPKKEGKEQKKKPLKKIMPRKK